MDDGQRTAFFVIIVSLGVFGLVVISTNDGRYYDDYNIQATTFEYTSCPLQEEGDNRFCDCSSLPISDNLTEAISDFSCFDSDSDFCGVAYIYGTSNLSVVCFNPVTFSSSFLGNSWPVFVVWYGFIIIYLSATNHGRSVARNCCGCIFRRPQGQAETEGGEGQPQPQSPNRANNNLLPPLTITTKRYGHTRNYGVGEDEVNCAICLSELKADEMVAIIESEHLFHAPCLTNWLAVKNQCPLCAAKNVARPSFVV